MDSIAYLFLAVIALAIITSIVKLVVTIAVKSMLFFARVGFVAAFVVALKGCDSLYN